jgi:tRNA threonylcarbamoyladenosine biosynthesis protein TsaE
VTRTTTSEAETAAVGRDLARTLKRGDVVLLFGELGAGKTAFVRGLAEGLGIDPSEISSPTFTIVQQYAGGRLPLLHVDLYRVNPREVDDLGLEELGSEAVTAIEWAERLPRPIAGGIEVTLRHAGGDVRTIRTALG